MKSHSRVMAHINNPHTHRKLFTKFPSIQEEACAVLKANDIDFDVDFEGKIIVKSDHTLAIDKLIKSFIAPYDVYAGEKMLTIKKMRRISQ